MEISSETVKTYRITMTEKEYAIVLDALDQASNDCDACGAVDGSLGVYHKWAGAK